MPTGDSDDRRSGHRGHDGPIEILGHPLCVAPGFPARVAKSKSLRYTDHGMSWELSEKNGFFSPFKYASD